MHVEFDPPVAAAFRDHALACLPAEACGLLARTPRSDAVELVRYAPIPNSATRPDRFAMDPAALVRVTTEWRSAGLRLGAVFHSHPDGRAAPSSVDVAGAALWPDLVQLILAVDLTRCTTGACTAWRFDRGLTPLALHAREEQPE